MGARNHKNITKRSIELLRKAINRTKLGIGEKNEAVSRLTKSNEETGASSTKKAVT